MHVWFIHKGTTEPFYDYVQAFHLLPKMPFKMDVYSLAVDNKGKSIFACSMFGIHNQPLPFHKPKKIKIKKVYYYIVNFKGTKVPVKSRNPFCVSQKEEEEEGIKSETRLVGKCSAKNRCNHNERHLHKFSRYYSYYYFRFVFFFINFHLE